MADAHDTITILQCFSPSSWAAKRFTRSDNGEIAKQSYKAGLLFNHEEREVNNLRDIASVMQELANQPDRFIIRGKALPGIGQGVRRKIHGEHAAFTPKARRWVMWDMDKIPCPAYLNPAEKPDEAVEWLKQSLPAPFNTTTCWYQFSSSQNVSNCDTLSVHLIFWCDREVSDMEWKQFFRQHPCNVDTMLFSGVQIHYTANPIFEGMSDPLPKRSGYAEGKNEIAVIPIVPTAPDRKTVTARPAAPTVAATAEDRALELLLVHYPKQGSRERFCATVAAILCRGGWLEDSIAEFVLRLSSSADDDECMKRHDNVYRICESVAMGRPAMGIPVLREEFLVENIDEILSLLGIGKPDIEAMLAPLNSASKPEQIKRVLAALEKCDTAEREIALDKIKAKTHIAKGTLSKIAKECWGKEKAVTTHDLAVLLMDTMRERLYLNGRALIRTDDGNFWCYNGRFWQIEADDQIKQHLLNIAPEIAGGHDKISALVSAAMNLLEGRVFTAGDPLRLRSNPAPVINCRNGEIWFDEQAELTFKPHSPESYLRYCSEVDYDPSATAPKFDQAVLEIFRNSQNPSEMHRHFVEFMGYACQPWRKVPTIMMFYGSGGNGKTQLAGVIERLIGRHSIMSCRVSEIESNRFITGELSNKLMFIDDDVDAGTCLPDGTLKKISEEKTMTGERKHRNPFEFTCRAIPLLLANEYPTTRDLSHGILRRMHVIPFSRRFKPEEIRLDLFDNIWLDEKSGILNRAIEGFQRLKQRGRFDEPSDCTSAKQEWQARSNPLCSFIDEVCVKGADKRQKLSDFYMNFQHYALSTGIKHIHNRSTVRKRLEMMGYQFTDHSNHPVISGLESSHYIR